MIRPTGLLSGPVAEVFVGLGVRLEFLVPTVALASMAAGIIVARVASRIGARRR
jgi:hypothetical protein